MRMTHGAIAAITTPANYGDGGRYGLVLTVRRGQDGSLNKAWIQRFTSPESGKRRAIGLGSWPEVSYEKVLIEVFENIKLLRDGVDPIDKKHAAQAQAVVDRRNTFRSVAESWFAEHRRFYKQKRSGDDAHSEMRRFLYPVIGNIKVSDIKLEHVITCLDPIWQTKTSAALRCRWRIQAVLTFAQAKGLRKPELPNPARAELVNPILGKPRRIAPTKHNETFPWRQINVLVHELREVQSIPARALEFQILTGARRNEVRHATWDEIDFALGIWTVPAARMKNNREWRVPLPRQALTLLATMQRARKYLSPGRAKNADQFIFPGERRGAIGVGALTIMKNAVLQQISIESNATVHGFRGTMKQWGMAKGYSWEVQELSLSHAVGTQVSQAYQQSEDFLSLRRKHLQDWADWCDRPCGDVVPLRYDDAEAVSLHR